MKEPSLEKNVEHNEDDVCHKLTTFASMRTLAYDRSGEDDATSITQVFKATENDNDCCSNALQGTSVSDSNLGKTEKKEVEMKKAIARGSKAKQKAKKRQVEEKAIAGVSVTSQLEDTKVSKAKQRRDKRSQQEAERE
ncbi:hypothetical protein JHK82_050460 [Glycine max]|nr:hypothetical protein JHK85_051099 [Glycine max]KAG5091682.1 hypothetical protein JHK82_050460 [Glycine max]